MCVHGAVLLLTIMVAAGVWTEALREAFDGECLQYKSIFELLAAK